MILIEKNMPGFNARRIKVQGIESSGSAYLTFDNLKVPISNLIGQEGKGFQQTLFNFNHERFGIAAGCLAASRSLIRESMKFSMKRKTFGKRLIDHAVIRNKLGHMIRQVEAVNAMAEQIAYQLNKMNPVTKMIKLPGAISLFKVSTSQLV
jgi:alkylation response protein AidB-like acyl-CoA dehydrogenase